MTAEAPAELTAPEDWGDARSRTVTWHDPMITAAGGCTLDESVYNPIGVVHGGLVCTLLDTVAGCAVHTTLPKGMGYTSIELKVSYLRPVHATSGPLTAIGRVVKPGRRVAFSEGEILDAQGRAVATASSSLLVFPIPPS
jgi:uncharacterized protein (TIGR00369 family)